MIAAKISSQIVQGSYAFIILPQHHTCFQTSYAEYYPLYNYRIVWIYFTTYTLLSYKDFN